jgi:hypothetical protein
MARVALSPDPGGLNDQANALLFGGAGLGPLGHGPKPAPPTPGHGIEH